LSKSKDRRNSKRIAWESGILVKDADSGRVHRGMLYNFNSEGFYFECDAPLKSGCRLSVKIENFPDAASSEVVQAKVKWAEEIVAPVVMYHYGIGAEYSNMITRSGEKKRLKVISGGIETVYPKKPL
jgi:hypothetical protein